MKAKLFVTVLLAALGVTLAQPAETPLTPGQFVAKEGVQAAYTVKNNALNPVDALQLMLQCAPPISTTLDTDRDGRNDTLRVFGFAIVSAQVYQARGVTSLAPAIQKAQLRANGAAAEFFGGLQAAVQRSLDSRNTEVSGVDAGVLRLSDLAVETVSDSIRTNANFVLRGGQITGHRIVSLGDQGLCVVARYELPLDQRSPRSSSAPAASPRSPISAPASGGGFTPPPPGTTGDF